MHDHELPARSERLMGWLRKTHDQVQVRASYGRTFRELRCYLELQQGYPKLSALHVRRFVPVPLWQTLSFQTVIPLLWLQLQQGRSRHPVVDHILPILHRRLLLNRPN
jgi:hypothetical protein